jgi:hypothetical protein
MLCYTLQMTSHPKGSRLTETWHDGEAVPVNHIQDLHGLVEFKVLSVQADGGELDHIRHAFTNLPFNYSRRVQVWHGDFAEFILRNL